MRELFIYYAVAPHHAGAAQAAAQRMQQQLCDQHPGLTARLLTRAEPTPGSPTWMEIYAAPQGVDAALQAQIELAAQSLAPWLAGPRHIEAFDALS